MSWRHPSKFAQVIILFLIASLTITPFFLSVIQAKSSAGFQTKNSAIARDVLLKQQTLQPESDLKFQARQAEMEKQYTTITLSVPFWQEGDGFESTLVVNNTTPRAIQLQPVIYRSDGTLINAALVTVDKNGSLDVALKDIAPGIQGRGQVKFSYVGARADLNAQMLIVDGSRSLSFNQFFVNAGNFSSSRMEGVFLVPRPSTRVELAVSNMSQQEVTVSAVFRSEHAKADALFQGPSLPLILEPHQTVVLDARPFLDSDRQSGRYAVTAIFSQSGAPGDVLVQGLVSDPSDGFSANMRFMQTPELTSGNLYSPVFQLTDAVTPTVVLNNTNSQEVRADLKAYYTVNGNPKQAVLRNVAVPPNSALHVDLDADMRLVPQGATNLGLEIENYGSGLLADVLLIDGSDSQVLQVSPKGYEKHNHSAHSFPFRIGETLETMVTLANPSDTDEMLYGLFLLFDGKNYTAKENRLRPGEVRNISIKALRDQQIPGQHGELIPLTTTIGQVKVAFHGPPHSANEHLGKPVAHIAARSSLATDSAAPSGHHHSAGSGGRAGATIIDTSRKITFTTCDEYDYLPFELVQFPTAFEGGLGNDDATSIILVNYDSTYEDESCASVHCWSADAGIANLWDGGDGVYVSYNGLGDTEVGAYTDWIPTYYEPAEGEVLDGPDCSVSVTSITVNTLDPDNDDIEISLLPVGHSSTLIIELTDTMSNHYFIHDTTATGSSSPQPFHFNFDSLPAGTWSYIYIAWGGAALTPSMPRTIISCGDDRTVLKNEYIQKGASYVPECGEFTHDDGDWGATHGSAYYSISNFLSVKHGGGGGDLTHPVWTVVRDILAAKLDTLYSSYGAMTFSRIYSCPTRNSQVSVEADSRHIYGDAADINAGGQTTWTNIKNAAWALDVPACVEPADYANPGTPDYGHVHIDFRFISTAFVHSSCATNWLP